MHAFSTTTLTGFLFLHDAFYFRKLPAIFVNSLDVFGICSNGAFEENLEMEMIYF